MSYQKFEDKFTTAKNEKRAWVEFTNFKTLWFNTGTKCNLACQNCYIESSPTNDRLSFLTLNDVKDYIKELNSEDVKPELLGFTGGEPFINPQVIKILEVCLQNDYKVVILTNAFKILKRHESHLLRLKDEYADRLQLRISLDHYSEKIHEDERGAGTFLKTIEQVKWLNDNGFNISIAGRSLINEDIDFAVSKYQDLLNTHDINLKLEKFQNIVIFPEMNASDNVPEITTSCWGILNKDPADLMCASERMIVKRKEDKGPVVVACTLLAYDKQFELGNTLKESKQDVFLNHNYCSKFCVLGGASCSATN